MASFDRLNLDRVFLYESLSIKWTSFGTGPALIFIHGTPWSSQLWYPIARCFASKFTVYMYDLPGYGSSMISSTGPDFAFPTYTEHAKVFCALLDHWASATGAGGPFQPHIVTHDIGGHIALRALLMTGRSFSSLAMVDCGASYPVDEPFFSLVRENASVFVDLPAKLHEALVREYIRSASSKGFRKDQEDMLVAPYLTKDGQRAFYLQIKAQRNEDVETLRQEYRKLDVPLHIIWAQEDTWVPVERARMLQEAVGGSLKIIEHAGHLVQLDSPEELLMELEEWLRKAL